MAKKKQAKTKFRKLVLSPGAYPLGDETVEFDESRLRNLAQNGNTFLATGARIPVPYAHVDDQGELVSPVNIGSRGAIKDAFSGQPIGWRSDLNSGFVESFEYGSVTDVDGTEYTGLVATMEIDGNPEDQNSAAYKIGNTIQEVSIGIQSNRKDKLGNEYDELPIHVAAVTNPVDSVQPNFQQVETFSENVLLFNTSAPPVDETEKDSETPDSQEKPKNPALPDDAQAVSGADQLVSHVVEGLRKCGFDLPEDTNLVNFFERMTIAIRQRVATESAAKLEDDDNSNTEPKGSQPSGAPIAMSEHKIDKVEKQATVLFAQHLTAKRHSILSRIDKLVKSNRITATYAKEKLVPQVEKTITLSTITLDDIDLESGELPPTQIETVLDALEESAANDLTQPGASAEAPAGEETSPPADENNSYWSFDKPVEHEQTWEEAKKFSSEVPV